MELSKKGTLQMKFFFLGIFLTLAFNLHAFPSNISARMLYFLHHKDCKRAFEIYLEEAKESQSHDWDLLQQAALSILQEGSESIDPEIFMMTLFGSGISANPTVLPILEKALLSKDVKAQVIALQFLGRFEDNEANLLIEKAFSSPFLLTRLEAALLLAKRKQPDVLEHVHSLLVKIPHQIRPLFAQIIVELESAEASAFLRKFLNDASADVRCETLIQVADHGYDDLLPTIRFLATHLIPAEQECCAYALSTFKDESSLTQLKKWCDSKQPSVKLAAYRGLALMGDEEAKKVLYQEVSENNLSAFPYLDASERSKLLLLEKSRHPDPQIRLNAVLALLKKKETPSLESLIEILSETKQDLGYSLTASPGHTLNYWKIIPHASQMESVFPGIGRETLRLKQQVLRFSLELPEPVFQGVAEWTLKKGPSFLIPGLMELMINHPTAASIALLKEYQQKAGAPLVRTYCTLALYRMKEPGPYEEQILSWLRKQASQSLIQFTEESKEEEGRALYSLNPEETSQLLVSCFEALAQRQSSAGIEALIHAIVHGNPKNRYALAGLLMRTSE